MQQNSWHFNNERKTLFPLNIHILSYHKTEIGVWSWWILSSQLSLRFHGQPSTFVVFPLSSWLISICYILPFCDCRLLETNISIKNPSYFHLLFPRPPNLGFLIPSPTLTSISYLYYLADSCWRKWL